MRQKVIVLCFSALLSFPVISVSAERAEGFLNGEPACFRIHTIKDNSWSFTLKLIATSLKSGPGVPVAQVNGLMHGSKSGSSDSFHAELTGTATIAKNISMESDPPSLQIGLFESDFAPDENKTSSGVWIGHYGVELKTSDLTGTINGTYSYTPIKASGTDPGAQVRNAISEKVEPIDCKDF